MEDHQQQEKELWIKYWQALKTGDTLLIRSARNELVLRYSAHKGSLVWRIAWRIIHYLGINPECLFDLINDGLLYSGDSKEGLLIAIEQYDPGRGVSFEVFARKYIWYAMLHGRTVRNNLTPYQILLSKKLRRLNDAFEAEHHRHPTLSELSKFSGISIQQLKRMEKAGWTIEPGSLEQYLEEDGAGDSRERDIADPDGLSPEEVAIKKEEDQKLAWIRELLSCFEKPGNEERTKSGSVRQAVEKLSQIEQQVLLLRFWFKMDYKQIASRLGISVENARVILHRALKGLKGNFSE